MAEIIVKEHYRERPTWDEYFMGLVKMTASRSSCDRLQVGCLLVRDNRIISQGYNGYIAGCSHVSIVRDNHEQATIHAEQNAILDCAKRGVSCDGCIAYITHYPCIICYRLLCGAGIREIRYIEDYKNDTLVEQLRCITGVSIQQLRETFTCEK